MPRRGYPAKGKVISFDLTYLNAFPVQKGDKVEYEVDGDLWLLECTGCAVDDEGERELRMTFKVLGRLPC